MSRRRISRLAGVALAVGAVLGCAAASAAEEKVTLTGVVSITEDDDWNIVAVKLTLDDGTVYQITPDEKGLQLGDRMERKRVEVTGAASEREGKKWLTVASYKEVRKAEKRKEE